MTEQDHVKLSLFLVKNKDVFSNSLYDLPGTDVVQHRIETGNNFPVRQRMYRAAPAARREIEKQVEEMLKHGIIKKSESAH